MKTSTDRILTTHVGSLPRPESIKALLRARLGGQPIDEAQLAARVAEAVAEVVRQQAEVGLDVISDGEMGKTSFLGYAEDTPDGLRPDDGRCPRRAVEQPGGRLGAAGRQPAGVAGVPRVLQGVLAARDASRRAALGVPGTHRLQGPGVARRAISPPSRPRCKASPSQRPLCPPSRRPWSAAAKTATTRREEDYVFAIAEALRTEYRAIVDAGFILQIDDPGLGETWDMMIPAPPLEDYRRMQARNIEALNHALAGIPEDRVRYHLCWGSWQGPHVHDLGLRDIVDLVLRVKAQAYSIEAATPRHSYEWRVWEDVKLPEGKVLIPGVIAHTTAVVEHPETVAERLMNFARLVGRERVMAGADCGFAQGALYQRQHPSVMWAKFEALVEGARLASERLWRS